MRGEVKRERDRERKSHGLAERPGRERRAEAGERASEVETRGSCLAPGVPLFPQTVAPNATHLSRPTYRAILKPACFPGARPALSLSLSFPHALTRVPATLFHSSCCGCSLRPTTRAHLTDFVAADSYSFSSPLLDNVFYARRINYLIIEPLS